jgi:hypothetical protein
MIFRPNFLWGFGIPPSCVTQTHPRFFDDSVLLRIGFFEQGMLAHSRPDFGPSSHLFSGWQCLQDIRGRAPAPRIISFGPAVPSSYSRTGFSPSNYFFRASSAFKLFEDGLRSLELFLSGQQCLQVIRGRTSVPRVAFFRASSAFKLFEDGLRSLELFLSGQQCLQVIRGRTSVPRVAFFWASSAFKIFEAGLRPLKLFLSGQQCLQVIRGRASVPRIISFGPAVPSRYSRQGFGPSNYFFRASSAFKIFEAGLRSFELSFSAQ